MIRKRKIKKIGILGGTFNPIHNGHVLIAKIVKEELGLEEIWLMPTFKTLSKNNLENNVSYKNRIDMISIYVKKNSPWLKLSTHEIYKKMMSFSYDSLKNLSDKYPYYKFYFIMGSDSFSSFEKWYRHDEINRFVDLVVVDRGVNIDKEKLKKYNAFYIKKKKFISTSSTSIRDGNSDDIYPEVRRYISKNFLYIKNIVLKELSVERAEHSLLVGAICRQIANKHNYKDLDEAYYAGVAHDLTKERSTQWHINFLIKHTSMDKDEIFKIHKNILHAYTSAYWMKEIYLIKNKNMINAMLVHTTGCSNMKKLDKILYISDKVAHTGDDYKKDIIKKMALENLELALSYLIEINYKKHMKKKKYANLEGSAAYEQYVKNNLVKNQKAHNRFNEILEETGGSNE